MRQLWNDLRKPIDQAPLYLVGLAGLVPGLVFVIAILAVAVLSR